MKEGEKRSILACFPGLKRHIVMNPNWFQNLQIDLPSLLVSAFWHTVSLQYYVYKWLTAVTTNIV